MAWTPTEKTVKAAWRNFRKEWDFQKRPELVLPLHEPRSSGDYRVDSYEALTPQRMWVAICRYERGRFDGKPAERIIATVPDTDIRVQLEFNLLPQTS